MGFKNEKSSHMVMINIYWTQHDYVSGSVLNTSTLIFLLVSRLPSEGSAGIPFMDEKIEAYCSQGRW